MTNAELRAAVERVRPSRQLGNTEIADRNMLVMAYLAEHPADEDGKATAEWIKAVLPANGSPAPASRQSAQYKSATCDLSWIDYEHAGLWVFVGYAGLAWWYMTRGQFRSLCRALSIPLTEAT